MFSINPYPARVENMVSSWAPNNASKGQMGIKSAFEGLMQCALSNSYTQHNRSSLFFQVRLQDLTRKATKHEMHLYCNTERRFCSHRYSGKAINITYFECVFVAWTAQPYFSTCHKRHDILLYPLRTRWGTYLGCCSQRDGARNTG